VRKTKKMNETLRKKLNSIANAFCPTGEGGGVDPSCGSSWSGKGKHPDVGKFKQARVRQPDSTTGLSTSLYTGPGKDAVRITHSKYSSAMRRGSALSGYSTVFYHSPTNKDRHGEWNIFTPTVEKEFRGDDHEQKATAYAKRIFGIEEKK